MNFLKRAGAILMVVAIFASSCNKYADDFEQINTKLDALAMTVQGVTTLNADLTALKAQVTALQTAVAAIPTATAQTAQFAAVKVETDKILAQIAAITTTLGTVATAGTATKAVVDKLAVDLAALTTKITADNAAMTTKLTALGTSDVAQSAQLDAIVAANASLLTKITAIQASLVASAQTGTDADAATALTIGGLQALLDAQKLMLDQILANTAMYNGDVNVTSDAEVVFYLAKIAQLGIVNGNVKVDFSAISATKLVDARMITSKINAVIGSTGMTANTVTVNFKQGDNVNLSTLTSVAGAMTLTGTAKGAGADVNIAMLSSVGGTLTLDYDGPYAHPTLSKVGGDLLLVNKGVVAATTPLGTTSINLPAVAVTGKVDDVIIVGALGVVVYPLATDVTLAGGVSSLTAAKATNIKLGSATYGTGLGVSSSTTAAATIDLSAATGITGVATVTGFGATAVNLSKLVTATGGLTVTTGIGTSAGTVDLTAYNEPAGLVVTGPKTLVLPAMVAGPIVSTTAETVTLAKHEWASPATINAVTNLTLGNVNANVNLSVYSFLVTASVSGKTQTKWGNCFAGVTAVNNANLTTLVIGGVMNTVSLVAALPGTDLFKLTSVTTSGVVNKFVMTDVDAMLSLTLGHGQFVGELGFGATGSDLTITNNDKLASVTTTALDKMNTLTVTGNAKLAAFNFSSYVNLKDDASAIVVNISGNNGTAFTTASYTPAFLVTGSTPYQEAIIKSNSILTLRAYFAKAAANLPVAVPLTCNIDTNLKTPTAIPADKLSALMIANKTALGAGCLIVNATNGIDTYAEMALVVAE